LQYQDGYVCGLHPNGITQYAASCIIQTGGIAGDMDQVQERRRLEVYRDMNDLKETANSS
jgi:hypothetical protein